MYSPAADSSTTTLSTLLQSLDKDRVQNQPSAKPLYTINEVIYQDD